MCKHCPIGEKGAPGVAGVDHLAYPRRYPLVKMDSMAFEIITLATIAEVRENTADFLFKDISEMSNTIAILRRRVECYELPVTKCAIVALCAVGRFNPGQSILALVEALECMTLSGLATITAGFITHHVFKEGFYAEADAYREFDRRKSERTGKYDAMI